MPCSPDDHASILKTVKECLFQSVVAGRVPFIVAVQPGESAAALSCLHSMASAAAAAAAGAGAPAVKFVSDTAAMLVYAVHDKVIFNGNPIPAISHVLVVYFGVERVSVSVKRVKHTPNSLLLIDDVACGNTLLPPAAPAALAAAPTAAALAAARLNVAAAAAALVAPAAPAAAAALVAPAAPAAALGGPVRQLIDLVLRTAGIKIERYIYGGVSAGSALQEQARFEMAGCLEVAALKDGCVIKGAELYAKYLAMETPAILDLNLPNITGFDIVDPSGLGMAIEVVGLGNIAFIEAMSNNDSRRRCLFAPVGSYRCVGWGGAECGMTERTGGQPPPAVL